MYLEINTQQGSAKPSESWGSLESVADVANRIVRPRRAYILLV